MQHIIIQKMGSSPRTATLSRYCLRVGLYPIYPSPTLFMDKLAQRALKTDKDMIRTSLCCMPLLSHTFRDWASIGYRLVYMSSFSLNHRFVPSNKWKYIVNAYTTPWNRMASCPSFSAWMWFYICSSMCVNITSFWNWLLLSENTISDFLLPKL